MRRPSLLAPTLALLVAAAADAAREEPEADAVAPPARGGGLGDGGASSHESVSSEPLTFEFVDPEPVDRARLLEAEGGPPDPGYLVMEGVELFDGEEAWGTADADGWDDGGDDEGYVDFGAYGEDEEYSAYSEDEDVGYDYGEDEEFEHGDEMTEDEPSFDSTYESEDGDEFFVREGDEVGVPAVFEEPIVRRLRRVTPSARREADEDRHLAEKEELRDESAPIFEPTADENGEFDLTPYAETEHDGRELQSACGANQKRVQVEIQTDKTPWETSWDIKKANGQLITKGPPGNTNYAKEKRYVIKKCLSPGTYRFTMRDRFSDGMCGTKSGWGLYNFYIAGAKKFSSPAKCSQKWGKREHTFTIRNKNNNNNNSNKNNNNNNNSNKNNNNNNNNNGGNTGAIAGRGGCTNVKIQFKVDKYGKETTVKLSGGGRTHLESVRNVGAYQTKTLSKCVPPGTYILRLVDKDGICCGNGQGWYKMFVGGQRVVSGGYFVGSKTHTIKIGSNWKASMSARDREWLNSHNSRRRKYNGGRGYVGLRWSRTLKADALAYARKLANNCNGQLVHAKGIQDGENLAKNKGSGTWGKQYPVENIMKRFVEDELKLPYPRNAHYTQVVWRATQYVGCGEAAKVMSNRQTCRVQVCRYARTGNCGVRNGNWRAEAWKDDTQCGRPCPKEGCFA